MRSTPTLLLPIAMTTLIASAIAGSVPPFYSPRIPQSCCYTVHGAEK